MNPFSLAPESILDLMQRLTPRQLQIVELLAMGHDYEQITSILSISRSRVKHLVWRACQRTGIDNRTQLIVIFVMWKVMNGKDH